MLYRLAAPALFALDPEFAHRLTVAGLGLAPIRKPAPEAGSLATRQTRASITAVISCVVGSTR